MLAKMHANGTVAPTHYPTPTNITEVLGRETPLDSGNEGFMVFTTSLLWILVPGCGFFYSGMARSKSALSMMTMSLWSIAIVSIQWFVCGYSLAFSLTSGNRFIGDFRKAFYMGVRDDAYPTAMKISEISFCFYQGVTATLPAALISGALAERARIMPALFFIFLWTTLVYCPCAFWSLNPKGWSFNMGVLDFGGGAPVHVPASAAAAVYSYFLGPRLKEDIDAKPHSMLCIQIGTVLIWFGSFGYNAGSAFGANLQAVFSCIITNLSGAIGALTWAIEDYFMDGKCDAFGFCMGAVVGLIVITPASGFIHPAAAFPIAIIGSTVCRWGHEVNRKLAYDDALDVFATHGLAGIVGILLAGVFAQSYYGGEDVKGWMDGHWSQILYQLEDTVAGCAWSTGVSIIILWCMNKIPRLKLRLDDLTTIMDEDQMGIMCYEYVEDIRIQVDTATWKISPETKVALSPELIMASQTAVNNQQNGKSNHHKNIESPLDENDINAKNIVANGTWQNYWH